jgi:tryptophan-rich sensory protein
MDWSVFIIYLSACFAASATGALFPTGSWYYKLLKPWWTPPNWMFPIAWAIFYLLLAISGSRVASMPGNEYAVGFWSLHIALNTLWTPVFFGAHRLKAGMIIITLLWLSAAGTIYTSFKVDYFSGLIILPYILWVSYAAALNFALWRMNLGVEEAT